MKETLGEVEGARERIARVKRAAEDTLRDVGGAREMWKRVKGADKGDVRRGRKS